MNSLGDNPVHTAEPSDPITRIYYICMHYKYTSSS